MNRSDWWCKNCNFKIYASKSSCSKCGVTRYGQQNSRQEDWWCKTCNFKVFGSKPCCSKCGGTKNQQNTVVVPVLASNEESVIGGNVTQVAVGYTPAGNVTYRSVIVPAPSQPVEEAKKCVICFDADPDSLLMPCKHLNLCYECAIQCMEKGCPTCRTDIDSIVKVYT